MIVTDLQPGNKPAFPSLSVTEGPFLIEVQQPLSQINSQCPPFMTGIVCSLHDELEGKRAPRLKVPKEYTLLGLQRKTDNTKYRYTFPKWNNYSSFIPIDRRQTAVIIPFGNTL